MDACITHTHTHAHTHAHRHTHSELRLADRETDGRTKVSMPEMSERELMYGKPLVGK